MTTASHTREAFGTIPNQVTPEDAGSPEVIVLTRAEYEQHATLHWRLGHQAGIVAGIRWADRQYNNAIAEVAAGIPAPAHEIVAAYVRRLDRQAAA